MSSSILRSRIKGGKSRFVIVHGLKWTAHTLSDEQGTSSLCMIPDARLAIFFSLCTSLLSAQRDVREEYVHSCLSPGSAVGNGPVSAGKRMPACYGRTGLITQKWLPCSILQAWVPGLEQHRNSHFHGWYLKLYTQKEECSSTPCTNKLLLTKHLSFHFHFFFGPFNITYFLFLHFSYNIPILSAFVWICFSFANAQLSCRLAWIN